MPDQSSSDERCLPAPYQSPWGALREDVPAAAADLRLRFQELWRRNREGDLSTPGFWPADLAPLFWPVVLALIVVTFTLGLIQLKTVFQEANNTSVEGIETIRTTPPPEMRSENADSDLEVQSAPLSLPPLSQEPDPPLPNTESALVEPEPLPTERALQPMRQVDPLLSLLAQADADGTVPDGLLLSASPLPDRNAAVLVLDMSLWDALAASSRRTSAELWWHMLEDQGYDDITMEDVDHNLLARPARVGGGMIMFDPPQL